MEHPIVNGLPVRWLHGRESVFLSVFCQVASGELTQQLPFYFPNAESNSIRTDFCEITLEENLDKIPGNNLSKSTKYFINFQNRMCADGKTPESLRKHGSMMIYMLERKDAAVGSRRLLLQKLSWMGSDVSIPVIMELGKNSELKELTVHEFEPHQFSKQ